MKDADKFYIDGEWVEPTVSKTLEFIDPSTEQPMRTIALGSAADAEKASRPRGGPLPPSRRRRRTNGSHC